MPILVTASYHIHKVKCIGFYYHKPHYFDHYCKIYRKGKKFLCEYALSLKNRELGKKRYAKNHIKVYKKSK